MKPYEIIPYCGDYWGIPGIAFDKLDGNCMRFEYSRKRGVYKAGTKNMMIDKDNPDFGFGVPIFIEKYEKGLNELFRTKKYRDVLSCVCFAELVGTKTEFGRHEKDDTFDITLFDVFYKKGLVPPREFVKDFGHLGIPKVIYDGNLNKEFVRQVKTNELELVEGVVFKAVVPKSDRLYYCKIKADAWFDRLRAKYPQQYEEEIAQAKLNISE